MPSVSGPKHSHPGLSLSPWPAPVSAAAAVLTGVKGRFYYSHGRANALIQRRGTVPSGQREGGRNLPSTCWKGFKADFTPSSSGSGKQGSSEPGRQEPSARSREGEMLLSARRRFPRACCLEQDSTVGWGWEEQTKLPSPSSSSSSSSPPSSSSSSTSLSASCSPFSSFSLARQNIT